MKIVLKANKESDASEKIDLFKKFKLSAGLFLIGLGAVSFMFVLFYKEISTWDNLKAPVVTMLLGAVLILETWPKFS